MSILLVGLLLAALGAAGKIWVSRRRFYRRNMAGVEEFRSYGGALITRAVERVVNLTSWCLLVVGLVAMASNAANVIRELPKQPQAKQSIGAKP